MTITSMYSRGLYYGLAHHREDELRVVDRHPGTDGRLPRVPGGGGGFLTCARAESSQSVSPSALTYSVLSTTVRGDQCEPGSEEHTVF